MRVIIVLIASLLAMQGASQTQRKPGTISLTISAAQQNVKAGSEVRVRIVVANTSDHQILVRADKHGHAEFLYDIDVHDDQGNQIPKTKYYKNVRGERTGEEPLEIFKKNYITVGLEPGETVEDTIDIDKLYDISLPGKYAIQVRGENGGSKTELKSNILILTVTP